MSQKQLLFVVVVGAAVIVVFALIVFSLTNR
jgi:hypothetical protein